MLSIFLTLLRLVVGLTNGLFQRMLHVHLRRMHILLLLGGMFYISLLGLVHLLCCSSLLFIFRSSVCLSYPLLKIRHWNLQLLLFNCLFFHSVLLIFASHILELCYKQHIYIYNLPNWWIGCFIKMQCPSVSHNTFCFKVYISIATQVSFAHYLHRISFSIQLYFQLICTFRSKVNLL